jgi:hypothetical protein
LPAIADFTGARVKTIFNNSNREVSVGGVRIAAHGKWDVNKNRESIKIKDKIIGANKPTTVIINGISREIYVDGKDIYERRSILKKERFQGKDIALDIDENGNISAAQI